MDTFSLKPEIAIKMAPDAMLLRLRVLYIVYNAKLVSHWHANSSRLLREFSRGTFARHSCECRENFHVSRTSRELVAKVLNMFKNWMRIFFPKYFARLSRDCRATVVRRSCECRESVAATFWRITMRNFCDIRTNVVRVS